MAIYYSDIETELPEAFFGGKLFVRSPCGQFLMSCHELNVAMIFSGAVIKLKIEESYLAVRKAPQAWLLICDGEIVCEDTEILRVVDMEKLGIAIQQSANT